MLGRPARLRNSRYLFLPLDIEKLAEAGRVEVVQLSGMPLVDSPRLIFIQQCSENHSTVDLRSLF